MQALDIENINRESHFITQCQNLTEQCQVMLKNATTFIPNFKNLPKKRQYQILVHGYEPENQELRSINTKIMIATQNFIFTSGRFISN